MSVLSFLPIVVLISGGRTAGYRSLLDDRMHDGRMRFILSVPQSQARKISGINTSATQLRSDDGSTALSLILIPGKIKLSPGALMWLPLWLIFLRK